MSWTKQSVCKMCRREGVKLYRKGVRCETAKCAITRRNYQPGQHSWTRGKPSEYGTGLREKQKCKRYYGVLERQFRRYFFLANRMTGNTGANLLSLLERRLDSAVYQLGLAPSRRAARLLVAHGHVLVNGRRCSAASRLVRVGDRLGVLSREKTRKIVGNALEVRKGHVAPAWLSFDETKVEGAVTALPRREDVTFEVQEQLIVELMSK
ncbi:MAG: 30S ribosomal protein S4 [Planctomycetes bacterium]|nr:30S ribosomal protein S4 [Planctomycetota bacterium]